MSAYRYIPQPNLSAEGAASRGSKSTKFVKGSKTQFALVYWLTVLFIVLIVQPIKNHAWESVQKLGDNALAERHFELARLEYTKLKLIKVRDPLPNARLQRVDQAEHDILTLRDFYRERNDAKMLTLMDQATKTYDSPDQATINCQELAKQHEFELALVCITNTTTSWPGYRDGWVAEHIIAQLAGNQPLADQAQQKALGLDPNIIP